MRTAMGATMGAVAVVALIGPAAAARAEPANTLQELWPALTRCWKAPPGTHGSEITIAFALKRNGEVLGKPWITYSRLTGDGPAQQAFVASALAGLARCTPVAITDALGGAIAGRRLSIRFRSRAPELGV